jgi:pimeloyl-ACP methyl ester carboxylesterase
VVQVGATVLSRSGSATVSITGKVTYNDDTTTTAAASVSGVSNGTDDTFYGFKAPEGKTIVSLAFTSTSFRSVDDFAFIATEGGTTPPTVTTRTEILNYTSTVSTDANGPLDLKAELNYDSARTNAPVMVLMHPFSGATGHFNSYRTNAVRMRDAGFFVISPAMRGREGSDGTRDNGGVEVYDIHDAIEALKLSHPTYIDATNISIIGYSGGGGNVMSALTKFPDTFRVGAAYFGMSDYGYNTTTGWYFNGAGSGRTPTMDAAPGNPTPPADPLVTDSYHARASNLASKNNPYSEIHLYANDNETISPKINITSYRDHAIANESTAGEFDNITAHIGLPGVYQDFNGNSLNDANELQYWPHQNPTIDQEQAGDLWYRSRLLAGTIPQPVLNASDELFVAGYVKTKRFGFWLGDGQNAAGSLTYSLSPSLKQFTFVKASILATTGKLTVDTSDTPGATIQVKRNGTVIDTFTGGGLQTVQGVVDGDVIRLEAGAVVEMTYATWQTEKFGAGNPPESSPYEDFDGDGILNLIEFALNLNPAAEDAAVLKPSAALVETTPGNRQLEFKFRQRTGGTGTMGMSYQTAGVTYTVQTSADLDPATWTQDHSVFEIVGTPVANGDGTETVTVRLNGPIAGKRFVRLKVTPVN